MWLFTPCQECVFSSSDLLWIKYQVDHNASYSLLVSLDQNIVNSIFNCTCVCVYAYIHFWHHVLIKVWHCALLTYTILLGTPSWFIKQMKQLELSCFTAKGVRKILQENIYFWITMATLYFCEFSWRTYINYQWRPVSYNPVVYGISDLRQENHPFPRRSRRSRNFT